MIGKKKEDMVLNTKPCLPFKVLCDTFFSSKEGRGQQTSEGTQHALTGRRQETEVPFHQLENCQFLLYGKEQTQLHGGKNSSQNNNLHGGPRI